MMALFFIVLAIQSIDSVFCRFCPHDRPVGVLRTKPALLSYRTCWGGGLPIEKRWTGEP